MPAEGLIRGDAPIINEVGALKTGSRKRFDQGDGCNAPSSIPISAARQT
jgi:hypothetical protein